MSSVDRTRVEALRQEYERQRDGLDELRRRMGELSVTAVSARREVSVTVGPQGTVTDLRFPTSAYRRLAPTELSTLLLRTIGEAREQVLDEAVEIMTPLLPPEFSLDPRELLSGRVSVGRFEPSEPLPPPVGTLDRAGGAGDA
ncbi:YbaB/EbfC family nucleoid-associated protein [Actinophytocola sp.]|jgi:hypothetical protein|uniref:YbaB/EbfC family nucleoid-associated protein n=1 Tax=Actinophytocola sp. TaxID=1872138 RepID=UPI002D2CCE36|nr:YbaB/EbfC family nucleoid-associated protein [Actinophytocola sp.]HYQ63790.1 YbaB/EbfC family nucleoid-associated protein [Actinophytocola sp.]